MPPLIEKRYTHHTTPRAAGEPHPSLARPTPPDDKNTTLHHCPPTNTPSPNHTHPEHHHATTTCPHTRTTPRPHNATDPPQHNHTRPQPHTAISPPGPHRQRPDTGGSAARGRSGPIRCRSGAVSAFRHRLEHAPENGPSGQRPPGQPCPRLCWSGGTHGFDTTAGTGALRARPGRGWPPARRLPPQAPPALRERRGSAAAPNRGPATATATGPARTRHGTARRAAPTIRGPRRSDRARSARLGTARSGGEAARARSAPGTDPRRSRGAGTARTTRTET